MMRRIMAGLVATAVLSTLVALSLGTPVQKAKATPISTSAETYLINGRIFPDPHGCGVVQPEVAGFDGPISPYAKGNTCAFDFLQYEEMTRGFKFLQETFPKFTQYYTLNKDFKCSGKPALGDGNGSCPAFKSAGLPVTFDDQGNTITREKRRIHMFRVTDETSNIPLKDRKWFVFPSSIHGIERAGAEGSVRAAEDLATWGACENLGAEKVEAHADYVDCEGEVTGETEGKPYPLLEASPNKSLSTGDALKKAVVVFIFPNPDGWLRGDRFRDRVPGSSYYQRYNGNGVDLNRDWPTSGFTFRPYTPASEPETKAFSKILPKLGPKDKNGNAKWAGGIDLHGQLIDRAFSFTLLGAGEHDYAKNQRIVQLVKEAYLDAENRLGYSPLIKPNEAPESDPGIYGVQWGTVWDTIDYTITGGIGDWINNPIGLNADGIDNEMSASHLANCGVGTCFDPDIEQLHVDGNKSLIYGMINFSLIGEDTTFDTKGRVAYVKNPGRISAKTDRLVHPPKFTKLPPQEDILDEPLAEHNSYTYEFDVKSPKQKVYNGGIAVSLTCATSPASPACELTDAFLQRQIGKNDEGNEGEWETINSYFLQSGSTPVYSATGKALHANLPTPGRWRVMLTGNERRLAGAFDMDIDFTKEKGWPDPGQIGYKVTTMNFWKDLKKFAKPGLEPITVGDIRTTNSWKNRYDSIVITNRVYDELANKLKGWVQDGGNLVLTDQAVGMLDKMGIVNGGISSLKAYAGYINFETSAEEEGGTYDHPSGLAKDVNQPGAAEGGQEEHDSIEGDENHRHQTYEPVPIGYSIQDANDNDNLTSPVWYVTESSLSEAKGEPAPVGTTGNFQNVSLGQVKVGKGFVRWAGALLPDPSNDFDHPFGLNNYALTYSGYQVMKNLLTHEK
ncbi:MAG: hypothetical protein M3285_01530 [Actinomycetota bacterium]|nr:hypothetical protein [Actinomycetota bacterium]